MVQQMIANDVTCKLSEAPDPLPPRCKAKAAGEAAKLSQGMCGCTVKISQRVNDLRIGQLTGHNT